MSLTDKTIWADSAVYWTGRKLFCVLCRQFISEGFPSNSAWKITFQVGLKIGRANKERRKRTDKIKLLGTNGKEPTQTTAAKLTLNSEINLK